MFYLDTYALMEIDKGNPNYSSLRSAEFKICDITLCEFYGVVLREQGRWKADDWLNKLSPFSESSNLLVLTESVRYRSENKSLNLSFPDAVGYVHSKTNHGTFVTGDKSFEKLPHVKYVK